MRNCWVRDIADFAKYALLRRLCGDDLSLGVIWYLTTHAAPSKPIIAYLSRPDEYAALDEALFSMLAKLDRERGNNSTVDHIAALGVLPSSTAFYRTPLTTRSLDRATRPLARQRWFAAGVEVTASADVVFLDPDTGVLPPGRRVEHVRRKWCGDEYASIEEILTLSARGQSVVLVQFGAPQNFEREPHLARQRLAALREACCNARRAEPWGVWWRDRHKVGLLVLPADAHAERLHARRDALLGDSLWARKLEPL